MDSAVLSSRHKHISYRNVRLLLRQRQAFSQGCIAMSWLHHALVHNESIR